ncbi:unnamed protein product [Pleuronectes platessa]|uniref:Uncharacterized protein n=1 Tax=Pleuronectes platessa TaxID=8262 RepID=A0A9N7VVA6_PLEPL|nr:unnamed protein product [Pleuronectes platessa]
MGRREKGSGWQEMDGGVASSSSNLPGGNPLPPSTFFLPPLPPGGAGEVVPKGAPRPGQPMRKTPAHLTEWNGKYVIILRRGLARDRFNECTRVRVMYGHSNTTSEEA